MCGCVYHVFTLAARSLTARSLTAPSLNPHCVAQDRTRDFGRISPEAILHRGAAGYDGVPNLLQFDDGGGQKAAP